MAAVNDVDQLIEQFNLAQGEFIKGNPEPMNDLFSHRDDVTLNNPLSPPAHGWEQVAAHYGACRIAVQRWRDSCLRGHREARNA
jgi:hypothetical protein